MNKELLFNKYLLSEFFIRSEQNAIQSIDNLNADKLLTSAIENLYDYFYLEFKLEPIHLFEEKISVDNKEVKIDVSQDRNKYVSDRSRPFFVDATEISYFIPFEGNEYLLKCQPSRYSIPPKAILTKNEIQLSYTTMNNESEEIRALFDNDFSTLRSYLKYEEDDINQYNKNLKIKIIDHVNWRKQKVLADKGLVESLGFPLKRRNDSNLVYTVPVTRKKINLLPANAPEKYSPEPVLDDEEYNHILQIMSNMVLTMERSPHAFSNMQEEDIRWIFIVLLNSYYEGQATGETFNYQGKTDILIRVKDKNIFIAECKFWTGEKGLIDTVDQLLGYLTWRDTKTAIILFNRNKNFSNVVSLIPDVIKTHNNYKKTIEVKDTICKFVFRQKNDSNREIKITTMAFDVPGQQISS